jgi:K+-transporting ATPase KdpF subunit
VIASTRADNIVGLIISVLITAYLVYTLVFPEKL